MRTLASAALSVLSLLVAQAASAGPRTGLVVTPLDREPAGLHRPTAAEVAGLRAELLAHSDDRAKHLALVRGLLAAHDLDGALASAKAWRAKDAYNLVAVRALGDVYMERGEREDGERVYSAIVELLPRDPDAQRALATLLKQRGDLPAAETRLTAAIAERPDDGRLLLELADVELRTGQLERATAHLEKVIAQTETSEQIRYPAKQRLGQILGEARRKAKAAGNVTEDERLRKRIDGLELKGGLVNDIKVYLTWDTDRTDVDLWVTTPTGEKVFYEHKGGAGGEALFDDVTDGYGPESFTATKAQAGEYIVEVNYFSAHRGPFPEARGEVVVVTDEGRSTEQRRVLPYRLYEEKQTVRVAKITSGGAS